MKRRLKVICEAVLVILFFTSCQKEITNEAVTSGETPSTKVKTYAEVVASSSSQATLLDSFILAYDSKDRLTSLTSLINSGNRIIYEYKPNNTYTMDMFVLNNLSIHEVFFLNNNSLVDSTIQSNGTDTIREKYFYDAKKQHIGTRQYFVGSNPEVINHSFTYDNNGNKIKETSDKTSAIKTYDYYPDLLNTISVGELYFYKNKNLTKTTTYSLGTTTITGQHTYTFDSNNRETSEKVVTSDGDTVIKKFTYY